jgi:hypothetical protein
MSDPSKREVLVVVAAWVVVGLPLAWGVLQVINKSLDLFR